jgi:hypothetical protein
LLLNWFVKSRDESLLLSLLFLKLVFELLIEVVQPRWLLQFFL